MATILVVDDEPDLVEIVRLRLERDGHTILSAPNGQAALSALSRDIPDLVILDIMMPGIDGFEVLSQIKNDPRTAHVPVIMLSAKTDLLSRTKAGNRGVDYYVTKPFQLDALSQIVENVLAERGKGNEGAATPAQ